MVKNIQRQPYYSKFEKYMYLQKHPINDTVQSAVVLLAFGFVYYTLQVPRRFIFNIEGEIIGLYKIT